MQWTQNPVGVAGPGTSIAVNRSTGKRLRVTRTDLEEHRSSITGGYSYDMGTFLQPGETLVLRIVQGGETVEGRATIIVGTAMVTPAASPAITFGQPLSFTWTDERARFLAGDAGLQPRRRRELDSGFAGPFGPEWLARHHRGARDGDQSNGVSLRLFARHLRGPGRRGLDHESALDQLAGSAHQGSIGFVSPPSAELGPVGPAHPDPASVTHHQLKISLPSRYDLPNVVNIHHPRTVNLHELG